MIMYSLSLIQKFNDIDSRTDIESVTRLFADNRRPYTHSFSSTIGAPRSNRARKLCLLAVRHVAPVSRTSCLVLARAIEIDVYHTHAIYCARLERPVPIALFMSRLTDAGNARQSFSLSICTLKLIVYVRTVSNGPEQYQLSCIHIILRIF